MAPASVSDPRPIAITLGDPAGIGPEIVVKLFDAGVAVPAIVIGDVGAVRRAVRLLGRPLRIESMREVSSFQHRHGVIPVLEVSDIGETITLGQTSAAAGRAALDAIVTAADLALDGRLRAVVTAPVHKEAIVVAGSAFPGHTELLAARSGVEHVAMMMVNSELRVLLVSIHVPLSKAVELVTFDNEVRSIRMAHAACRQLGIEVPRVAVAGLNPHAGENGLMGREDESVIRPAVAAARASGIVASGPWPPDTIFMRARRGEFDIVVAQYHDQGLIPIKYLGIETGVNATIGLPFVRTSVDHGTAFDIAGKGLADAGSLHAAFDLAVGLTTARRSLDVLPTSQAASPRAPQK